MHVIANLLIGSFYDEVGQMTS